MSATDIALIYISAISVCQGSRRYRRASPSSVRGDVRSFLFALPSKTQGGRRKRRPSGHSRRPFASFGRPDAVFDASTSTAQALPPSR
ncbi:hypothetical protein HMPREF1155_1244 [Slackia sp. CM382]|nr:hypothetical protein HMPREF1155_1244 [Slackia sp. CM382]